MDGFQKFLLRGNVVDLAVAVVIGAAFATVINAFVDAFLTPLLGLVAGTDGFFADEAFTLGSTKFPYGAFISAVISFVIVAAVIYFFVVKPVQSFLDRFATEPDVDTPTKACTDCLSDIPEPATRCAFCTVEQPRPATRAKR